MNKIRQIRTKIVNILLFRTTHLHKIHIDKRGNNCCIFVEKFLIDKRNRILTEMQKTALFLAN